MEKIIKLSPDFHNIIDTMDCNIIKEKFNAGPKGTRIIMRDADSGKILEDVKNKIVVTGSLLSATQAFGVDFPVEIPNYNTELNLDNTLDYNTEKPKNVSRVCLFCVGDSGCGASAKDVFTANYIDRIDISNDIIPFRYVDTEDDISDDLRKFYYGRKTFANNKIGYYFKKFESEPELHLKYTDGTLINDQLYKVNTTQAAECYVETKLKITRSDLRDYCEQVIGWDKARMSTLSLCYAWYDDTIDDNLWYQQIYPYSKLNFSLKWLVDLTEAFEFQYQVFY